MVAELGSMLAAKLEIDKRLEPSYIELTITRAVLVIILLSHVKLEYLLCQCGSQKKGVVQLFFRGRRAMNSNAAALRGNG